MAGTTTKARRRAPRPPIPARPQRPAALTAADIVESIVGCKWSLAVLSAIRAGVVRPGRLERRCAGISTKVLNQRLKKMLAFGLLERREFPGLPLRVEYHLTDLGQRMGALLDEVAALQREMDQRSARSIPLTPPPTGGSATA